MGSVLSQSCLHSNSKVKVLEIKELHSVLFGWVHCIEKHQCENCGEIWREDVYKDRIKGYPWSSTRIDPKTCQHPHFSVDSSTIQLVHKNQNLVDDIASLAFLAFFRKNITNCYYESEVECTYCGGNFKAGAPVVKKFENKSSSDVPGEWEILYTEKPDPKYKIKEYLQTQKKT